MDLEQRKEELLTLALKDNHFNNATSYWLINNNHTDKLINKISDKKTKIICTSLLNREDFLLEEKIIRLGKLLSDYKKDNSKIKFSSIKNKEIIKLTKDIKKYIFSKKDTEFYVDYNSFKDSLNKINDYLFN